MESNKEARRVLNRSGVDLTYCQFSCVGSEIHLMGWLCKHDGSEFNSAQIQAMIYDFQNSLKGFNINGNFDNWQFTSDSITPLAQETSEQESGHSGAEQITYEINLEEYDFEAS